MYLINDTTGIVGEWNRPQIGWSPVTQEEINGYLLKQAKKDGINVLKEKLSLFRDLGFVYNGWTFSLDTMSAMYVKNKADQATGGIDKYKYYDLEGVQRNFENVSGFSLFKVEINEEDNRIMELYNKYKGEINTALTPEAVDTIISQIDFAS